MIRKVFLILVMILVAAAGSLYFSHEKEEKKYALTLYGNVDVRQVDLSFRVSGEVREIFFEEGDLVESGSLVAKLDKQPYQDLVNQAQAGVESVIASLKNSEILLARRKELISDGSIGQEDLDNALANKVVLEANLKSSQAALAIAETNLSFTEITAPTKGTILTRIREPGSVVNPGEPVYTLSILSPVWIRAYVSERHLGQVHPGMEAKIYTDTPQGKVYTGHVGFISPVAEFTPKTVETAELRTDLVYRLRIYADNPDLNLRQGMPVTVVLP